MTRNESFHVRVKPDTRVRLDSLATSMKRSKSFLIETAIETYLDLNEWQLKEIKKGLNEIENGLVVDHEVVKAKWEAKVANKMD